MDVDAATTEALAALHAAILTPSDWPAAISRLSSLFDSDHAICFEGGHIGDTAPAHALAVGIDRKAFATLLSPRASALAEPWHRCIPPGRVSSTADVMTDDEVMNTDLYQEFIKPVGGFHALTIAKSDPAASFQLTLCRSRRGGAFERPDKEKLQRVLPALSLIFALRCRLVAVSAMSRDLTSALDHCREAVILVDADHRPVFVNGPGQAMLASKDGLRIDAEGLAGTSAAGTHRLRTALAAVLRGSADAIQRTLCLPRGEGRLPLLARMMAFPQSTMALRGMPATSVAIFLSDPEAPLPVDAAMLSDVFALTRREAEVTCAVASGQPLLRIARRLGIGLGTLRQHLKQIYDKTGAHDRAALVALIRSCAGN